MNPDEQNKAKNKLEQHFFIRQQKFTTTETWKNVKHRLYLAQIGEV